MSLTELKWRTLTSAVNEMKSPNQFLKKLLFRNHQPVNTEDIDIQVLNKAREIAPFVRKNGEGIMVGGYSSLGYSVQPPNVRLKRPFTPSELLFGRRPDTDVYISVGDQTAAIREHIARDLQVMADYITNAEEYLCAMALQGTIAYSVADQEVFTITYPKPAGNTITLSTFWDDATPADTDFHANVHAVKRVMADEVGLAPTDAICGASAADALRGLIKAGLVAIDNRNVTTGQATFAEQFNDDGVIYLGRIDGIDWWEYGRTASLNGSATDMIRTKYVEFISRSPASGRVLYYGAIPDMKALQGRRFVGERFSKSWEVEDPSAMMSLIHSRPLPVPRRPGANVSVKVVSG